MTEQNRDLPSDAKIETCFVMMPFAPQFERYYWNIFVPAISRSGLTPVRGDSIFGPSAIMGDVWRLLKKSSMALADLTGRNPNVFYELGLAHTLGKAVILVSSNNDDIPFDLRGLRVILYDKDDENWGANLQAAIERAIAEIRADPVRAVPATFSDRDVQACLTADPLQVEVRRLAEEVRAIRLGGVKLAGDNSSSGATTTDEAAEVLLHRVFPHTRALGFSWGQARHVIDLVLAGMESEALSYIEAKGVSRPEAERAVALVKENRDR